MREVVAGGYEAIDWHLVPKALASGPTVVATARSPTW